MTNELELAALKAEIAGLRAALKSVLAGNQATAEAVLSLYSQNPDPASLASIFEAVIENANGTLIYSAGTDNDLAAIENARDAFRSCLRKSQQKQT